MAVGIKAIETIQHKFPTTVLMFFQVLVLRHFEYFGSCLLQITSTLLLSLEKQMIWALKSVYLLSSIKDSFDLRMHESVLGIRQRIELKSLTCFSSISTIKSIYGQNKVAYRKFLIEQLFESNNFFGVGTICFIFLQVFFHLISLKWNSLPVSMRDTSVSLQVFRSRLKKFLLSESNAVPVHLANTCRHFRFN